MSVILIGPVYPYRGGIAHFTTLLAQQLAQMGGVRVISYSRQYPRWLYPGDSDKDPSAEGARVTAEYLLDALNPLSWEKTARTIESCKPPSVILQWWTNFWAPATFWVARRLRSAGIPVTFLIHNVMPHEPRVWDAPLARVVLGQGSRCVTLSGREQVRLLKLLPAASVTMQPHPLYRFLNLAPVSMTAARQQLGLPLGAKVLLFFGLVRPYKGLAVLIEALGLLRKRGVLPHLVVAGEFWEAVARYEQLMTAHGVREQVHLFARYLPDEQLPLFFGAADVFVAPYTGGTQSGALRMAMGFGLPLVASDAVFAPADAPPGYPVVVAPAGDAAALAEAIVTCWDAPRVDAAALEDGWFSLAQVLVGEAG